MKRDRTVDGKEGKEKPLSLSLLAGPLGMTKKRFLLIGYTSLIEFLDPSAFVLFCFLRFSRYYIYIRGQCLHP